ncbi:MAG: tyrosine--tRNA ligase [Candidatus Jordarchaeales archaeon]|nr:tyrosine--tRNA ligase [Candidatus Jordarchaeia archaeon]
MDIEEKIQLVRSCSAEIVTEEELRELFEVNEKPVAYDGFEPSGLAHLPVAVYRPIILEKLMKTGIRFKLLLADSFAWINNKLGGDIERIRDAGKYFIEVWKAAGVDFSKVDVVWHKEHFDDPEYWKKVMMIAKNVTVSRTMRALTIAGRKESASNPTAFLFYPVMQCADIFQLEVDICQLGIDQRKVNMLAREVAPLFGRRKPIAIHHPLLLGLKVGEGIGGFDEDEKIDFMISSKMSKSVPDSAIFIHDSREDIWRKIRNAFCPPRVVEGNPIMDIMEKIIFEKRREVTVERKGKDALTFTSYSELKESYVKGEIHPLDLKEAAARYLDDIIDPIRRHFEEDKRAREIYEKVRSAEVTR